MRPILVFSSVVWVLNFVNIPAYTQEISKYDLEQRASHHFMNHRYVKSSSDYEILHNMFPKDARYAYFLGRSYLNSNKNLDRAAELLKFAAIRNYGDDSYFYLGQVYHNSYEFDDAALALVTFKKTASERKQKKYDIDYWIALTQNARQAVTVSRNIRVGDLKSVASGNLQDGFQQQYNGKFIKVPGDLKSEADKESGTETIMFLPDKIVKGDYLYLASQSRNGKAGFDIYRVKRLNDKEFSIPEALPEIVNTAYDDAYPFFDNQAGWLYFSSKGHNSSGGYDIFRIQYDQGKNAWGIPEKLDFPVNSVRDDFQFALAADGKSFTFLTNRNTVYQEFDAITVEYPMPNEFTTTKTPDEVITCSLLMPASITLDYSEPVKAEPQVIAEKKETKNIVSKNESDRDYAQTIEEALEFQEQSDSINSGIQQLKLALQKETDYKRKQDINATIATLEKESVIFQKLADEKFAEAEKYRQPNYQGTIVVYPIKKGENMDPDNQFADKQDESSGAKKAKHNSGEEVAMKAVMDMNAGFGILNSSPYSAGNPIPFAASTSGLVYRIQLGSFTNEIPADKFGGLTPIFKEKCESGIKYYVGMFSSIGDARKALEKVKAYGYTDAFLISFYNDSKISIQEAREIEFAGKY